MLHVHDLVDFVSMEAERLADAAAEYVDKGCLPGVSRCDSYRLFYQSHSAAAYFRKRGLQIVTACKQAI